MFGRIVLGCRIGRWVSVKGVVNLKRLKQVRFAQTTRFSNDWSGLSHVSGYVKRKKDTLAKCQSAQKRFAPVTTIVFSEAVLR